ncbi:unnamed protein product [Rotaria socialis]|uniref:ILEI/PANDER domain-containing protein n=1 Tax=Rotaria socialis TaxID=392032 RepID=A0A818D344_9BILA|nr:unnamed protein product [Rotaria socialis]CAF4274136.1 unnamed protein product [Rotaria socialis]
MRKVKRIIHKQFGGVGNFFIILILVASIVIFINSYVLTKRDPSNEAPTGSISKLETVHNQNQTVKQNSIDRQRIQRPSIPDAGCEIDEKCADDAIPYKIVSGDGIEKYPIICFNNKLLVHKNLKDAKIGRGINLVALDSVTYDVKLTETYDTYIEETFLLRTLKVTLNDGDIIILASFDEMTYGLKEASLSILEKYGSQLIKIIKFRDSFVMIGQKGLARGKAVEMHQPKGNRDFAPAAHISGCAKFPLGQLSPVVFPTSEVNKEGKIAIGTSIKNCGLLETCKENEFAVHIYTGKDKNDEPKICVDGKYVMAKGINDAGRGINIVVVSNGKEVIRTGHFDTWQEDSTNLEIFLENLEENVILIAVTFDEASTKLSQHSKNLFFDLGSATIQNMNYRDSWAFVGRKGIEGFSPYEEISHAGSAPGYASPIDKRLCVPQTLKGIKIRPDPLPFRNDKRRDFCSRYDGYGDFCSDTNVDKNLAPIGLLNKTLEDNPIYSIPILVIAGISYNSLRMCLETLLMQPGIRVENVIVAVDEKFSEPLALIDLFGFRGEKTSSSSTYMEHYEKSLNKALELYPTKDSVIVIEEDLILSPDFLYTLALLSETFQKDETIAGIQLWNPNSYDAVNGSIDLIYRVDNLFGLGYQLKRTFYDKNMKVSFKECCSKRVWDKWKFSQTLPSSSFLMPDISRIFRRPIDGNRMNTKYLEALFNRKRQTSLNPFPPLSNINTLRKESYDTFLTKSISSATLLKSLEPCDTLNLNMYNLIRNQNSSATFKYIYQQESTDDVASLMPVLPCFGLFPQEPLGLYLGVLRFSANKYQFYLVGSKSPLYKSTLNST